jgi:hypothetical protein
MADARRKLRECAAEYRGALEIVQRYPGRDVVPRHPVRLGTDNPAYGHLASGSFRHPPGNRLRLHGPRVLFPNLVIDFDGRHWFDLCLYREDSPALFEGHDELAASTGVTLPANNNFGNFAHFLQECVPALWETRLDPDASPVVVPAVTERFQVEILRSLGFRPDRMTQIGRGVVRFPHVDFHDFCDHSRGRRDLWPLRLNEIAAALRGRAGAEAPERSRKLFVSRRESKRRPCLAIDWLASVLEPLGFEEVDLSALSVRDQIGLFARATDVVAIHGAGLANVMFCAPGTNVVEIAHPWLRNSNFARLSIQFALRHSIYQEFAPALVGRHDMSWDIEDRSAARGFLLGGLSA